MSSSNAIKGASERAEEPMQENHSFFKKQKVEYDQFVRDELKCFEGEENGSVYFSSFNPVWPILGCGLSNGGILIIEWQRQTNLIGTLSNKTWHKSNTVSAMTGLGWNMDGSLLLTTFLDGQIVVWNKNTKTLTGIKDPNNEQIWAIVCNPFLNTIFATQNNQTVVVWDDILNHSKAPRQRFAFHSGLIRDVAWITEDKFFSCSDDGFILLCEIGRDSPIKSVNHRDAVLHLSWNNTSKLLGCISQNGSAMIWSIKSDEPTNIFKNERMKRPTCLTLYLHDSPVVDSSRTLIVCGLEDGSVVLWDDGGNGDPIRTMLVQTNSIWDISFSPDGMFLSSIDLQGNLVIWSTKNWYVVFRSTLSFRASKRILQWGGDGRKLAIANPSAQIHLIEAAVSVKNKREA